MDVRLQEGDRIAVAYFGVKDADGAGPIDCVVAYEDVGNIYVVLWKRPEEDAYQLMWRADWDGAMKYYTNFVGDLELECTGQPDGWSNKTIEKYAEVVSK